MSTPNDIDIPQVNGVLSSDALNQINANSLENGKDYTCQICGGVKIAPAISRCICGLRVCDKCMNDHYNG